MALEGLDAEAGNHSQAGTSRPKSVNYAPQVFSFKAGILCGPGHHSLCVNLLALHLSAAVLQRAAGAQLALGQIPCCQIAL